MTLKEIAREYGMSWDTVRRMFRAHGATWINRSDFQRQARNRALGTVLAMREAGKSLKEIAAALDTHPRRIKRILQEHEEQASDAPDQILPKVGVGGPCER